MDLTNQFVTYGGIILAVIGLIYAQVTYVNIRSMARGSDLQKKLGVTIYNGAMSFIKEEYKYTVLFSWNTYCFGLLWRSCIIYDLWMGRNDFSMYC